MCYLFRLMGASFALFIKELILILQIVLIERDMEEDHINMLDDIHQNRFPEFDKDFSEDSLLIQYASGNEDDDPQIPTSSSKKNKMKKLEKTKPIRSSRNAHKTYHCILRHWLERENYTSILPKYHKYFNKRVYFTLVLDEILKQIDGELFRVSYEQLTQEIIDRKLSEIENNNRLQNNSEQSKHLKRVIEQIQFSRKACRQFVDGNVLESLITVYKRNQTKITKLKQFQLAKKIFKDVAGYEPEDS